jgi:hypothetical protein
VAKAEPFVLPKIVVTYEDALATECPSDMPFFFDELTPNNATEAIDYADWMPLSLARLARFSFTEVVEYI